jgi:hypothetical protein
MKKVLKYDITIKGEGIYECTLDPFSKDSFIVYVSPPIDDKYWRELFVEKLVRIMIIGYLLIGRSHQQF